MYQIKRPQAKSKTFLLFLIIVAAFNLPAFNLSGFNLSNHVFAADDHGHDEDEHKHSSHRTLTKPSHDQHQHDEGAHTHGDAHEDDEHHDEHENGAVNISSNIAEQSQIEVALVQSATLDIVTQTFGKLVIPPNQEAHIHARYAGLVKDIKVHVGDQVTKGDVLAVIESNESLQEYTVKAPMSGIVTQRQLNLGEVTDDEPLVVIVDDSLLWAELKIFPHQRQKVKQNQTAYLAREKRELTAKITHLAPSSQAEPYMLARAIVDNTQQQFTPGELLRAEIVVDRSEVAIAVDNRALQTLEGRPVVFVNEGDRYEPRAIKLGRTDGRYTEVLEGIRAGETYVVGNSYIIKADIEKAGAGHHH